MDKSYGLNEKQLAEIGRLEAVCNRFEALSMKLNWSTLRKRPKDEVNDFVCYEGDELAGYLALYTFNQKEAEVSAMTHPNFRRQGIFKQLLALARVELEQRGIPDFLFICERNSTSAAGCMAAIGAGYDFSEYKMSHQEEAVLLPASAALDLRLAGPENLDALARMDELCFEMPAAMAQRHLAEDIVDERRRILVATVGNEAIGKVGISLDGTAAFIYALCVLPGHRGQGWGRSILTQSVSQLIAEKRSPISLEVACKNESALSLYRRSGFLVDTVYDYYRLPV